MGLLAAKAAEQRSKYIVDRYHYGVQCNTCSYDYEYYAKLDFVSDCFDVCSSDVTVTSLDTTLHCTGRTPILQASTVCTPANKVLDCNKEYVTREMQAFEINSWMYNEVVTLGNSLRFEFTSAVVNGVSYLSGTRYFDITPANITTEKVGSLEYITNIITFLNSLNLPDITFYPGITGRTMRVMFPSSYTWQIDSLANGDLTADPHGAQINQTGIINLEQVPAAGYFAPPYAGSTGDFWQAGYSTVFKGTLC